MRPASCTTVATVVIVITTAVVVIGAAPALAQFREWRQDANGYVLVKDSASEPWRTVCGAVTGDTATGLCRILGWGSVTGATASTG